MPTVTELDLFERHLENTTRFADPEEIALAVSMVVISIAAFPHIFDLLEEPAQLTEELSAAVSYALENTGDVKSAGYLTRALGDIRFDLDTPGFGNIRDYLEIPR